MSQIYRCRAVATGVAGVPYYLTQYFDASASTTQQALTAFRNMLLAARPMQTNALETQVEDAVAIIETTTGQTVGVDTADGGDPFNGGDSGTPLPYQVQVGVNLQTPTYANGRRIQGHFSIPGISSSIHNGGPGPNRSLGAVTAFQGFLDTLVGLSTPQWVVFSRARGTQAIVTSASVNPRWFTLRSRLI